MKADRLQAFSDGIFAILITILVLEFKLPNYTKGHLFEAVLQQWPIMFAYLLTFTYIGILWLFHHDMFQHIERTTVKLNVLNLISIFLTTLLSYSMSLLSETLVTLNPADLRFAALVYSGLALLISGSYYYIYGYLSMHDEILEQDTGTRYFSASRTYPVFSMVIYLLAMIFVWLNVYLGLLFLVLGILNHGYSYLRIVNISKKESAN